jgi:hypothetical protein
MLAAVGFSSVLRVQGVGPESQSPNLEKAVKKL